MSHKYIVKLSEGERERLQNLVKSGKTVARTLTRARILLTTAGGDKDETIVRALNVGLFTIIWVRQPCVEEGVEPLQRGVPEGIIQASSTGSR